MIYRYILSIPVNRDDTVKIFNKYIRYHIYEHIGPIHGDFYMYI